MDNMKNIISSHNKKIRNSYKEINGKTCNCRNKSNCSLDNKCLTNKTVYKAEAETNNGINALSTKFYFGISETEFTSSSNNHAMSFRNLTRENDIKVSKFIYILIDQNKDFDITWSSSKKSSESKSCNLCLFKKLVICNFKEKER